jgi:undecaprenyl-diphosphatase
MPQWIETIVLGIIEGITEFLPISSTGHLIVAQHFLGNHRSEFFNVGIQSGAVTAVVLIYWRRLWQLVRHWNKPENLTYSLKIGVAFLVTVVLAFACRFAGMELPEDPWPVAWAVFLGALAIFVSEYALKHQKPHDNITWKIAIFTGMAQVVAAIFPGTSRSAATIIAAMLFGTTRLDATEFSFLLGIPTMFAAGGYILVDELLETGGFSTAEWLDFALGFVVSTIVAFLAVKWLLGFIRTHSFIPFAWYRLALGIGLIVWLLIR